MDESHSPAQPTPYLHGIKQGLAWIADGRKLVMQQPSLWFGMAAVYFAFGFLLKLIPFMGDLLLVLVTPMLLAGVVWGRVQQRPVDPAPAPSDTVQRLYRTWVLRPTQELIYIFTQEEKIFGAVLLGIVTLGLEITVKITGYLLIGGSMVSGLTADQLGAPQLTTLLGMFVIAILFLILAMGLIYSVPLTVLGNQPPFAAIAESFVVCRRYPVPLLALTLPFFLVYLAITVAFAQDRWLGYLLVISVGTVTLPVFVASVYRSYLTFFPLDLSATTR
jgi:hypothetical protein